MDGWRHARMGCKTGSAGGYHRGWNGWRYSQNGRKTGSTCVRKLPLHSLNPRKLPFSRGSRMQHHLTISSLRSFRVQSRPVEGSRRAVLPSHRRLIDKLGAREGNRSDVGLSQSRASRECGDHHPRSVWFLFLICVMTGIKQQHTHPLPASNIRQIDVCQVLCFTWLLKS